MNWIKALKESIDYIEENLLETLSMHEIAKVACSSPYHYQRMFFLLTNINVSEYIRNRRLSRAAAELVSGNVRVLDIAVKYGYESSESFSRAFKKLHGASPTAVRQKKTVLKAYPKLTIHIVVKGDEPMNYKIEKKPAFHFSGMKRTFSTLNGENFKKIPMFWQEKMEDGSFMKLAQLGKDEKCIGACMPMEHGVDDEFDYVIGIFSEGTLEGYDNILVPETDWAVFEVKGPIHPNLQDAWKRIFSEWFPSTGYRHANYPELEVYYEGDVKSVDYLTEIWIPIIME